MKIAVINDAHLDINSTLLKQDLTQIFIENVKKKKPDLVIIPGDLSNSAKESIRIIELLEEQLGVPVLFVPGNHDVFVDKGEESWNSYRLLSNHHSTLIDKPYHINDDYVIIGDIGWYDYSFGPDTIPYYQYKSRKKSLWIDAKYALWGMDDIDFMRKIIEKFQYYLEKNIHKKVIFVNHFVPYRDFIPYRKDIKNWNLCNAYMGSSHLGKLLDEYTNIKYVLFGHIHKRYGIIEDYKGKTIVCNPLGYMDEWETDDISLELEKTITMFEIN